MAGKLGLGAKFLRSAGAGLGLMLAPAALAWGAGEALFAPRPQAEPAKVSAPAKVETPAPQPGVAGGFIPSSGLVTPEIVLDEMGHKTLVIRGDEESGVLTENLAPTRQAPALDEGRRRAAEPSEKPYWIFEDQAEERPYFQVEKEVPEPPYWQAQEKKDDIPYWEETGEAASERPYWELVPERVEILAHTVQPAVPPPVLGPEPAGDSQTISYFMFQDEAGVRHLTNVPADPRYREFTVTVKVGRGLAGGRMGQLRFTQESLRPLILQAARTYNLDPALIAAVIRSESAFDAHAVSWAGAQGLMQLMPATARAMGCADSFDPAQNIMAGSRYLRQMLDTFGGDLTLAIAAYNCGPERVKRLWRVPNITETKNYIVIVSRNHERYKGQF